MGLHPLDWLVLFASILFIVIYGVWKTRGSRNINSFIKGDNEAKWWTVGLSVMATQASAITFMSTPGQAYHDGMGFVQFYFGLPIAMVVICATFIPLFHRLKVYTAYEFLENRFDLKTRSLTALLFLIQRGLAAGITIYAPAIVLSTILGWNLNLLNFIIGALVIIYTVSGGTRAVSVTQKQQMFVMMGGMFVAFFMTLQLLPEGVGLSDALSLAGHSGKMNILDFSVDPKNRYTLWSGITGGFFLALAYFGTDQSQVQRYLGGKSINESRLGLIFNGLLKVPMQFFILLCGVMVFVFFQFNQAPLFFNQSTLDKLSNTERATDLSELNRQYDDLFLKKKAIAQDFVMNDHKDGALLKAIQLEELELRKKVKNLIAKEMPAEETNDKDYVFISFILKYLPNGLIGLLLAVILSGAMSSTASELNALASTTTIDIYKRNIKPDANDSHYLLMTRFFTFTWGAIAILFACFGTLFENLIQFVNIVGSLFYGTILGVFIVGFYAKFVKANAVFFAAILSEIIVISVWKADLLGFLWLNVIGCFGVLILSIVIEYLINKNTASC